MISLSVLHPAEFNAEERDAYLRLSLARRRAGEVPEPGAEAPIVEMSDERFAAMAAQDQFLLTVAANGFGKRTSTYDYRVTGRGGKGIDLMDLGSPDNRVVAAFPVTEGDGLVLVTDGGQLIRIGINEIRIARRSTRGVRMFNVAERERVVSVTRLAEAKLAAAAEGELDNDAEGTPAAADPEPRDLPEDTPADDTE